MRLDIIRSGFYFRRPILTIWLLTFPIEYLISLYLGTTCALISSAAVYWPSYLFYRISCTPLPHAPWYHLVQFLFLLPAFFLFDTRQQSASRIPRDTPALETSLFSLFGKWDPIKMKIWMYVMMRIWPIIINTSDFKYKKRLLLRCIHHFQSDWLINHSIKMI